MMNILCAALIIASLAGSSFKFTASEIRLSVPARFIQQEQLASGARKIDEFGDINSSDWLARLDNFAINLQNAPNAKGFIVAYSVPNKLPGWPLRRAEWAKGYLIQVRGINRERVEVVNGGYRDEITFQCWIAEIGAQLPVQPFDIGAALTREKTPFLFDLFYLPLPSARDAAPETDYEGYLDVKGRYEPFVMALRFDSAARGCIIAYSTRRNRHGTDRQLAARQKLLILKSHSVAPDRIVTLGGGLREVETVELWLVPPGSSLPKPTPSVSASRRKKRIKQNRALTYVARS